jgi:hypothetical protein
MGHRPGEQLKQIEAEGGSNTITRTGRISTKLSSQACTVVCLVIAAESNPLGA